MNKKIILRMTVLAVVVICLVAFLPTKMAVSPAMQNLGKITYKNTSVDKIQVDLPFPDAVVGKDFSVMGKARGWFFEASFPVEVLDKSGKVLALVTAHPKSGEDWMTADFVNFQADIKVPQAYIGPATLVLKKDNPSGLPENDASVSFPITIEY
jgi:hypothetical protein